MRVGKIILLNTPIGNLGDMTRRVEEALKSGRFFAVEDTRVFKELLGHLGINLGDKKIFSLHDHTEEGQLEKLLELAEREDLYVASEAGSPIVSDPAWPIVVGARKRGIEVESYSGVSSPIMALELSGLPPIPFQFHGFLPRESGKRKKIFYDCTQGTHIFFEAPTRIAETVDELTETLPGIKIALVREMSKKFQEALTFTPEEWPQIKKNLTTRGEFVLLFHRSESTKMVGKELRDMADDILQNGAGPKSVSKLLGLILDRPTKDIYAEINRQKK